MLDEVSSRGWFVIALGVALSCSVGGAAPKPQPPPSRTELARASVEEPASLPLLENKFGVLGAPRDDTSFEYDVADQEDDPSPVLDGVPRFTRAVGAALAPYLETRRARLAAVSPDAKSMLVLTRLGETTQVHLVGAALGMRRQLTFGADPVEQAVYVPGQARSIAYRSDVGGNEDHQIFSLDLDTRRTRRLSDGKSRHGPFRFSASGRLAFTNNARNGRDMDLYVQDTDAPAARLVLALEGEWVALGWSADGQQLLMHEFRSVDESAIHLVDVATAKLTPLAPRTKGDATRSAWFSRRPGFVYAVSNRGQEYASVFDVEVATQKWRRLTPVLDWNVEEGTSSGNGRALAYTVNENGYSRLWMLDLQSGKRRTVPVPEGVISGLRFIDRDQKLAFNLTTPTHPEDVVVVHLASGRLESWTDSEVGGLYAGNFVMPELVRAPSFDGLVISALLYRPRGTGPFPVVLWMHGGPEDQARPAFDPIIQYFAATRRVAVLTPNVRGSDGYGKRFLSLDDREQRHAAVSDVGAMLDFVARDPTLDARRVAIHGASYGGFLVLASLAEYPERFVAGSNVVGMSDLVTFLENTRDYRRDLRRVEYGDERDPKMRAYLASISPVNRVGRIQSALLVAHGENDPRVPLAQAEQIVRAVRDRGAEAWFVSARGEGHSFRRRRSRDTYYRVMAEFMERQLLQRGPLGLDADEPAPPPKPQTAPKRPTPSGLALSPPRKEPS